MALPAPKCGTPPSQPRQPRPPPPRTSGRPASGMSSSSPSPGSSNSNSVSALPGSPDEPVSPSASHEGDDEFFCSSLFSPPVASWSSSRLSFSPFLLSRLRLG
eukprot:scaffold120205_cov35-Tisochrysis_lutea.AAC.5